jgi:prepilin-type N-terminal cleavage/methylation domain-containing protein
MSCAWILGQARRGWSADRPGFTLVEALVALVIAGLIVVGVMEAVAAGFRTQASAGANLTAVGLAETKLAELAALPADSLPAETTIRDGAFPPPFVGYRWRTIIEGDPATPALRGAAVLVEWDGGEFSLETVLYRRRSPLRMATSPGGRP